MNTRYPEYKNLDLTRIGSEIQSWWQQHGTFEKSLKLTEGKPPYVFYEGPPSANGIPGIHHVMARAIKDIFCRYKTLKAKSSRRTSKRTLRRFTFDSWDNQFNLKNTIKFHFQTP